MAIVLTAFAMAMSADNGPSPPGEEAGRLLAATDVKGILQIDLLKTDWHHARAYPTYLYYNPYRDARTVRLDVGKAACDVYDAVADRFPARGVSGTTAITVRPDSAVVVVLAPAGPKATRDGRKLLVGGVIVDYSIR